MELVELVLNSNKEDIASIFEALFNDCDWVIETACSHLGLSGIPEEPEENTIEYHMLDWLNTGNHESCHKVIEYAHENKLLDTLVRGIILDSADYGDYEIEYYFSDKLTEKQLEIMKAMFKTVIKH